MEPEGWRVKVARATSTSEIAAPAPATSTGEEGQKRMPLIFADARRYDQERAFFNFLVVQLF